jgi:hypothetical protein
MPILGEIPAEPILSKAAAFELMRYKCFAEEVREFHASEAKIRIVTAPARTSKSYSGAPECVYRALPHKPLLGSLQWIVGTNYETNKEFQYVWQMLVEDRARWTSNGAKLKIEKAHNNPGNGDMVIVLNWGRGEHGIARAVIEGKSSNNEKALQGEHVTQVCLSEAADHDARIWNQYLSTRYTWAIFPTTPKQDGEWLREMSEMGAADPSLSIETFVFPPEANPLYDFEKYHREEKKAALRADSGRAEDDPYFAEQFLGQWSMYTGRVLPLEKRNFVTLDPTWLDVSKLFVSTDYGYEDGCVALFWAVLPSGALFIWDEIYERRIVTAEFVRQIDAKLGRHRSKLAYACGDPKQPQVAHYMREFGLPVIDVNKGAQVDRAIGHRRLVDLLSVNPDLGHPMLYLDPDRCPKTTREWQHLHYREGMKNEYSEGAFRGADHAYDAGRYGATTRPEPDAEPERPNWLRELEQERRRELRHVAGAFNATRGLGRWQRSGRSPYSRPARQVRSPYA